MENTSQKEHEKHSRKEEEGLDYYGCRGKGGHDTSNLEGKMSCNTLQREESMVGFSNKEDKDMTKLFNIKFV